MKTRRVGRDGSFIPLGLGPVGIGIPRWLPLVLLYFAVVFGLAWASSPPWPMAATMAAALGPGVIGLVDLGLRLRTTHYQWVNSAGVQLVGEASILDRLTFRECGWYLPIVNLPLPLWLIGMGLSAAFSHSWRVF
ncbi:conserved membrane protein of unknown function [Magnetospirillum sp. XM-1]|uniref:hypothetical protein n=1 Tax=Magnetospirillum sp. XM-1 TaxID=1663591 RepID=UPI00073DCCC9|nr:hypothetical protein [Magnetospirillum sp. XM-1]CUW39151.1 conserved membrane protein of unknown function [Magnetospirillum sp. XM-1]